VATVEDVAPGDAPTTAATTVSVASDPLAPASGWEAIAKFGPRIVFLETGLRRPLHLVMQVVDRIIGQQSHQPHTHWQCNDGGGGCTSSGGGAAGPAVVVVNSSALVAAVHSAAAAPVQLVSGRAVGVVAAPSLWDSIPRVRPPAPSSTDPTVALPTVALRAGEGGSGNTNAQAHAHDTLATARLSAAAVGRGNLVGGSDGCVARMGGEGPPDELLPFLAEEWLPQLRARGHTASTAGRALGAHIPQSRQQRLREVASGRPVTHRHHPIQRPTWRFCSQLAHYLAKKRPVKAALFIYRLLQCHASLVGGGCALRVTTPLLRIPEAGSAPNRAVEPGLLSRLEEDHMSESSVAQILATEILTNGRPQQSGCPILRDGRPNHSDRDSNQRATPTIRLPDPPWRFPARATMRPWQPSDLGNQATLAKPRWV
jgi:hypothetical protein